MYTQQSQFQTSIIMQKTFNSQKTLNIIFVTLLTIIFISLISIHQSLASFVYFGIFFIIMMNIKCNKATRYIRTQLVLSVLIMVAGGFIFPADIEQIEELYMFIPFLYLIITPRKTWPIIVGFLLLTSYFPSFASTELLDFIEDSFELLIIISFATIMTNFQQKYYRQMKEFEKESNTDFLTRLSNRKQFTNDIKSLALRCDNDQDSLKQFNLAIIDLDGFKKINDQLGHEQGDKVLSAVAKRFNSVETAWSKPYRIGGDEFAFLIETDDPENRNCSELLEKILDFANTPFTLDAHHYISYSIGVSIYPTDTSKTETLYSKADLAMYKAKKSGKSKVVFYEHSFMSHTLRKYEIEDALKNAVENNEFTIVYQPKICVESGKCHSAEALIRWNHPKLGTVEPSEFIPIAEESGSIVSIGEWVLETVCKQIVKWRKQDTISTVAVNVSAVQLNEPDFVDLVKNILTKTGCRGEWLEIEQTETWIMENPDVNIETFTKLKELNITLSVDDFGTAFSSLSLIRRLPLDIIKIDKSFIDNCVNNTQDHMLVKTIIQLGHNLGMKIVAEGVESEAQESLLNYERCDYFQGYLFSKPISVNEFEEFIKSSSATSPANKDVLLTI